MALTFRNTDDCYFASGASFVDVLCGDVAMLRQWHDGPMIVGGGGFSLMPEALLDAAGADYGIVGDGEAALPALLEALEHGRTPEGIDGVVFKAGDGWRSQGRGRAAVAGLAGVSRSIVDNLTYFRRGGQIGIETKRGCPGQCIYCADPIIKGHTSRLRPPGDVVAELKNLLAMGIDHFHTCDSEFNLPHDHAIDVCRAVMEAGLADRIRWYAYATPAAFSRKLAALMLTAGCAGINFGADNGSDEQLERLGRGYGREEVVNAARICRELGIVFMYDLLLGGPGETLDTLRETIELMKAVSPDRVGVSIGVRVYPGTPLHVMLRDGAVETTGLRGSLSGTEPVFYISPGLGDRPFELARDLIGDDERFFVPSGGDEQNYNYNDNQVLQDAIDAGHRGAYWDILRKLKLGLPPG